MTTRTYPYKGWILMPSFKPVEVELAKLYGSYSMPDYGDQTASGKVYRREDIFPTKEAVIAAGRDRLRTQQANLDERQASIYKRLNTLTKASK